MTNLSSDSPRRYRGYQRFATIPVPASTTIYNGGAIQRNAGVAQKATGAGTTFFGLATEQATQAGASVVNTDRVQCCTLGEVELTVAGNGGNLAVSDVGAAVYLSDDNTFTLVSTSNQQIGKVVEVAPEAIGQASGKCWVYFEGVQHRSI